MFYIQGEIYEPEADLMNTKSNYTPTGYLMSCTGGAFSERPPVPTWYCCIARVAILQILMISKLVSTESLITLAI